MDDELVFRRLFDKLDQIDEQLRRLCDRLNKVESNHEGHLEELKIVRETKDKLSEQREKRIYLAIAMVGGAIAFLELLALLKLDFF
jgi:hypothetical protein